MFTGIIEDLGTIRSRTNHTVVVDTALDGIAVGDSIAVNGICLTAVQLQRQGTMTRVSFDVSPETIGRTSIATARAGTRVNIERALRADSRLGGHMVSGHVEATATIRGIARQDAAWLYTFTLPTAIAGHVVLKGSVTVDGISLTVTAVTAASFTVSIIPHTREKTTLSVKRTGDVVNLEPDLLMKYAAQALSRPAPAARLTRAFLHENGFV
jgi:riboflavin synthase